MRDDGRLAVEATAVFAAEARPPERSQRLLCVQQRLRVGADANVQSVATVVERLRREQRHFSVQSGCNITFI